MIQTQEKYLEYLSKIKEVLRDTAICQKDEDLLKWQIENAELIVPVVGGFSAGKSTIINNFLGENLLATSLTPETALATELRYDTSNFIEAVKQDGSIQRYEIDEIEQIKQKAQEYQYLKYYLNNERIKQIQPLVLVDMPGFNAPIEHHNQAIINYLSRGIYFIVAISVEDGTIQKSIIREISNIMSFGKGFTFCLTKTNLKAPSSVVQIAQEVKNQLKDYFDFQGEILLLGKDASEEMKKILANISPEQLIEKMFLEDLRQNQDSNISDLNMQISALKINKQEAEEAIEALDSSLKTLINQKEEEISKIKAKYTIRNVEEIVTKIGNELFNQKEHLSSLILNSQEAFNSEINSIVKQVLVSDVSLRLSEINQNIIEEIKIDLKGLQNLQVDMQWVDVLATEVTRMLNGLQEKVMPKQKQSDDILKNLPAVVPVLSKYLPRCVAIPATILNPILGVILAFLPEIVAWFKTKSQENQKKEKAMEYFVNSIIPAVKANARKSLEEIFAQCIQENIDFIYARFEEQIQIKQDEIGKLQNEKTADMQKLNQKIEDLTQVRISLQTLAEKYLYE